MAVPPHIGLDEPGLEEGPSYARAAHSDALSILIVDDNRHHLDILTTVLGAAGHRASACQSGAEAVKTLAQRSYDLVVLDMVMPEVNGLAVLKAMRQGGPNSQTPVFACTANHILARRELEGCFGIIDIIAKPIDLRALVISVARLGEARQDVC